MGGGGAGKVKVKAGEVIEELDVRGTAHSTMTWVQKFLHDLSREPVAKQVAVGGVSGWVVGYLSMKVGKVAATVVGGSLLVMQLAAHKGYIKVDWNRVNNDFEKNARRLKKEVESTVNPRMADEAVRFARENVVLATSFGGGMLAPLQDAARRLDRSLGKAADRLERTVNRAEHRADSWLGGRMETARRLYRRHVLGDSSSSAWTRCTC
ncbi:FUN14 domain-containing protein 1 [Chionoecetes opilio]|uniref:FUN14 domain-containing protein 1 n=1 Tax=Chionoecetes opilio TaxID=41210 RepID=A0A8J4YWG0_CHIOP|nr:FUN14 domain-containing protein 1 [Chionoecetes opilio]